MRILEAVPGTGINGVFIYARRIIPLLRSRGHEVWLAAEPGSWLARETAGAATLVPTDFARWPLTEVRRIADFCRANQIEVVHSHMTRALHFAALLRSLHGIPSLAHAHGNSFQLHWWFHDKIAAVSKSTLQRHRRRLAGLSGEVLHNFVDAARFVPPKAGAVDLLRTGFGLPEDCPVVVQVGEICPRKGQLHSVRAAAQVIREMPGVRFIFLGADGKRKAYRDQLNAEVARLGLVSAIIWAGLRNDVPELLGWADVSILPSLDDPFPLAALEVMACAVPLVANCVDGLPEIVDDGTTGLLVPPANPTALAEAILRLLRDPCRAAAIGVAGRAKVLRDFGPEQHVTRLEGILRSVAGQGKRAGRRRDHARRFD